MKIMCNQILRNSLTRSRQVVVVWICRSVLGELLQGPNYFFSCSVKVQFQLLFSQWSFKNQWRVKSVVETVPKPFQDGIHYPSDMFQKVIRHLTNRRDGIAALNKLYLHAAVHCPFAIFRSVFTTFLKISIKQLI